MPRFFYDVDDRGRRVRDELGIEHDDPARAMCDALHLLHVLAIENQFEGRPGLMRVTVRSGVKETVHEYIMSGGER